MLQKALEIGKIAGFPDASEIEEMLKAEMGEEH
jgi:hypothetical protein